MEHRLATTRITTATVRAILAIAEFLSFVRGVVTPLSDWRQALPVDRHSFRLAVVAGPMQHRLRRSHQDLAGWRREAEEAWRQAFVEAAERLQHPRCHWLPPLARVNSEKVAAYRYQASSSNPDHRQASGSHRTRRNARWNSGRRLMVIE